ncbi:MAG: hypothetical protein B7733_06480 [Myxococcales bacterium FL481]|nr:MAG: hypothetical protein B7733_06480 [Myxococcales bacterium FL481]
MRTAILNDASGGNGLVPLAERADPRSLEITPGHAMHPKGHENQHQRKNAEANKGHCRIHRQKL